MFLSKEAKQRINNYTDSELIKRFKELYASVNHPDLRIGVNSRSEIMNWSELTYIDNVFDTRGLKRPSVCDVQVLYNIVWDDE